MAFSYEYPRPSLTVDCVIFGYDPNVDISNEAAIKRSITTGIDGSLEVLLIKRADDPFRNFWAIPGGFVNVSDDGNQGEDIETAARRELEEETGLKFAYLEQLYTFGTPRRDPRGRVISVAHFALVRTQDFQATAGSDAAEAKWWPVKTALSNSLAGGPEDTGRLAFDHSDILKMAVQRLQGKIRYAPVGFNLLPQKFTLKELQQLYEVILNADRGTQEKRKLDKGNFRKKMLAMGFLAEAGTQPTKYRESKLYKFDKRAYDKAVREGFNFEI